MHSEPVLLSKDDYQAFTQTWETLPEDQNLEAYFKGQEEEKAQPSLGVYFSLSAVTALLSSIGITKVKIKFCIDDTGFNSVLFGTDEKDKSLSAYYAGTPFTKPVIHNSNDGNVPGWLGNEWINEWKACITNPENETTKAAQFNTAYGILNGYTYEMTDVLKPLFSIQTPRWDSDYLYVHFCLHRYYAPDAIDTNDPVLIFNLLLQTISTASADDGGGSGFYNISAPCPPTC